PMACRRASGPSAPAANGSSRGARSQATGMRRHQRSSSKSCSKACSRSIETARGEQLGLNDDEVAFYDALEVNDSAVQVLGDQTLRIIAQELVLTVRNNLSIDWTVRENVRAHLRVLIKRILRKYGYPPDMQEKA